jgi:hypothetical protein
MMTDATPAVIRRHYVWRLAHKLGTCTPAYLCTAEAGYDGPTGLGAPDGTAAF